MMPAIGFLLVRVRADGRRRAFVVPLPLFVLGEALEAVASLLRLGIWLRLRPMRRLQTFMYGAGLAELVRLPALLLRELRSHGPIVLAEVKDGNTHVSIRIV